MSFETDAQALIYTVLNGNITGGVYDDVPYLPDGQPRANFPYTVIGNDTFTPWDNDTFLGGNMTITLHIWSRAAGFKECKGIMGEIYDILHRASLAKSGYDMVDSLCEFSETMLEGDGETRHGVMRFRLTMQKEL